MRLRLTVVAAIAIAAPAAHAVAIRTHTAIPYDCAASTTEASATRVSVRGACWGEAAVRDGEASVDVTLWPAAALEGKFIAPRGTALPAAMTLRLQSAPHAKPELAAVEESCEINGATWRCVVPAIDLDVRIAPAEYIPAYAWSLKLTPGKTTTVPDVPLARGASVAGSVRDGAGRPAADAAVSLQAEAPARFGVDEHRTTIRAWTTRTNERGFFQFAGVPSGAFVVTVTKDGSSPARLTGVRVTGEDELALPRAIELRALGAMDLAVVPAVDAQSRPWRIRIDKHGVPWNLLVPNGEFVASSTGALRREKLEAGTYLVSVLDSGGNVRLRRDVEVSERAGLQVLSIDTVIVHGTLTAAGTPLKAALLFSDASGGHVAFAADESGTFTGTLPHEGKWWVQCTPSGTLVKRRLPAVDVKRNDDGVAPLALTLGGGVAKGIVSDEEGKPVEASVRLFREGDLDAELRSAADGTFEITGVRAGAAELQAIAVDGRSMSDVARLDVSESSATAVELTLHRRRDINAHLTTPAGSPLPGALIRYIANHALAEEGSGPSGEFSVTAARGAAFVDAIVVPPGDLPITLVHIPADPDDPQIVVGNTTGQMLVKIAGAPPWPAIRQYATAFPLFMLFQPIGSEEHPRDHTPQGLLFALAPGAYSICPDMRVATGCVPALVTAGQRTEIDARPFYRAASGGSNAP